MCVCVHVCVCVHMCVLCVLVETLPSLIFLLCHFEVQLILGDERDVLGGVDLPLREDHCI